MAVRLADAVVNITTDDKQLTSGLAAAETRLSKLGSVATGALMGVGFAAYNALGSAVRGFADTVVASIGAATDLNETLSKSEAIFGDSAAAINEWSMTAATQLGQSRQTALDAAATFAMFGKSAGLAGDDLTGFSTELVTLATDLASFNNTDPAQAIQALGAALRGESEPIRSYQVLLDDATLKARALAEGIWTGEGALTQQQRVLATYQEILAQTTVQQGDFVKTSDGLAGQQKILSAQWEDMTATIGQALLPVITPLITALNGLAQTYMPAISDYITGTLIPAIEALGARFGAWWESSGRPFVAAFDRVWADLAFEERTDDILEQLGRISAWFGTGGDGDQAITWFARMGAGATAFADAFYNQVQRVLGIIELLGQAMQALQSGNWQGAMGITGLASQLASGFGPSAFLGDFMGSYQETMAQLRAGMGSTSNITINVSGQGDPHSSAQAVRDALLAALYASGN